MWTIKYTKEVRDYIYDSYPYTEAVWQAVKALRQQPDGLPSAEYVQLEVNVFKWEIVNHTVVYERNGQNNTLTIFVMKPSAEV